MLVREVETAHTPESLVDQIRDEPRIVLLESASEASEARYSFVTARPLLSFRSFGSRCEVNLHAANRTLTFFGNPWRLLDSYYSRFELLEELDVPFPLGGCFGYWGYDLKNFVEPKLPRRAFRDLPVPDCDLAFYGSLVVFDHHLARTFVVSTGLDADGSRSRARAAEDFDFWARLLEGKGSGAAVRFPQQNLPPAPIRSNMTRAGFVARVARAKALIRAGDIYQVNLAQRLEAPWNQSGWELFRRMRVISPAPFAAYLKSPGLEISSISPESFLRLSAQEVRTRPIKGTRPRSPSPDRDAQLSYELQTSSKELAELVMITDLLRNDLGRVSEFGSVHVPELMRLERYVHVQHLVSTVQGRLRPGITHLQALEACFPGGSITGAPKVRAMEIIEDLEPVSRGPYTGSLGYLGFNRESQLSIIIRTALCLDGRAYFHAGAGIVADSDPDAEYEETIAKAQGFLLAFPPGRVQTTFDLPAEAVHYDHLC